MVQLLGREELAPGCQGFCLPTTSSAFYKQRLTLEREVPFLDPRLEPEKEPKRKVGLRPERQHPMLPCR